MERFAAQFTKYKIETRNKENRKIKLEFVISILFRVTFNLWNVCLLRLYQHDDSPGMSRSRWCSPAENEQGWRHFLIVEQLSWNWIYSLADLKHNTLMFLSTLWAKVKKKELFPPHKITHISNWKCSNTLNQVFFFLTCPWKSNSTLACSFVSGHHSSSSCINKLDRDVEQEPGAGEWRGARHWEGRGVEEKEEVGTTGGDRRNLTSATKLDQLRVSLNQSRARRSRTINYGDMITHTITLCPHTQAGVSLWLVDIKI